MTSIAVFGTSGALGKPVLDALTSLVSDKIAYPIKAITTKDKSAESTDKIQYVQGDAIAGADKLAETLKGTDVIISLVAAKPEILAGVEQIVKAVKPKIYIPSEFGVDYLALPEGVSHAVIEGKSKHAEAVEKAGIKVARVFTSFFRIPPVFLYVFSNHIGVDQTSKTVTYTENDTVQFSTGSDIGNVVALIATSDAANVKSFYRIYSGSTTVKDIVKELEKEQGVTYTTETKPSTELVSSYGDDFVKFLFAVFSLGTGKGIVESEDDNERELINPGQVAFKWSSW